MQVDNSFNKGGEKVKYKVITLLVIFLITFNIPASGNDTLYIGSFSPENEIYADFFISLNKNNIKEDLLIEFKSFNFEFEQQIIPLSRLNLNLKFEKINVETTNLVVQKENLIREASGYILPFNLKLLPVDRPGLYKNDLIISKVNGGIVLKVKLYLEINPWAIFELEGKDYMQLIQEDRESYQLKSSGGLLLKVASNTNWELYGQLNNSDQEILNKLSLKANTRNPKESLISNLIKISDTPKLISSGSYTVLNDQYWTEIEVNMFLDDITKIKTGIKNFPVRFYLTIKN